MVYSLGNYSVYQTMTRGLESGFSKVSKHKVGQRVFDIHHPLASRPFAESTKLSIVLLSIDKIYPEISRHFDLRLLSPVTTISITGGTISKKYISA